MDTYTPTGSVTYQRDENGIPIRQDVGVSDTVQNTIGLQEGIANGLTQYAQGRVGGIPTSDFSTAGSPYGSASAQSRINSFGQFGDQRSQLPFDPRSYGDLDSYRNDVQDSFMDQQKRNLQPVFDQQYDKQQQDLANRGLPVDGEAHTKASANLNREQSNAWQNASNEAIQRGGAEADRRIAQEQGLRATSFSEAQTGHQQNQSDISNQLQAEQGYRSQNIQENILNRNQNTNEIAMLLGQAPAMQIPQQNAQTNYSLQAPDVIGATYQAANMDMQRAQLQQQQAGSQWQGAANIAGGLGSLAFKSSRSYKENDAPPPERIMDKVNELKVRTWQYRRHIDPRQEIHIGPYAEDWKRIMGYGDGMEIAVQDAFGVAIKCIQELHEQVATLEEKVDSLSLKKRAPAKKRARK